MSKKPKNFRRRNPGVKPDGGNPGRRSDAPGHDEASFSKDSIPRGKAWSSNAAEPAKTNDPAWYGTYQELARDAGQFSFTYPTGSAINMTDAVDSTYVERNEFIAPGIMSINLMHTIGYTNDPTDAINVAMRNVYSYVRYANSGSKNYDAPDLMIYLLGMNDIYSMWAWLRRVYGIARTYSPQNRYFPNTELYAMGVNPSIIDDLANLRYYINSLAVKLSSMAVPGTMPFTARRLWLYSNIYSDSTSAKAQCYMFNPAYVYRATIEKDTKAGMLETVKFHPSTVGSTDELWTLDTIKKFIDSMFDMYYASEDYNLMSGDILKVFGSEGIVKFPQTEETYTVVPIYDDYVRSQIENSCIFDMQGNPETFMKQNDIHQNLKIGTGNLQCGLSLPTGGATGPVYADSATTMTGRSMINLHVESPNPGLVFEATRLRPIVKLIDKSANLGRVATGTEIVLNYTVYTKPGNNDKQPTKVIIDSNYLGLDNSQPTIDVSTAYRALKVASIWSQFDWAPIIYVGQGTGDPQSAAWSVEDYMFECDVWTTMSTHDLTKLHDTANLSLFNVPLMSRATAYKG